MGFGALFLLAFAGGLAGLYSLRPELITAAGVSERMRRLKIGVATGTPATGPGGPGRPARVEERQFGRDGKDFRP